MTWTPGIGDPTALGWATTFGYLGAAVRAFRTGLTGRRASPPGQREFPAWFIIGAALLLLGLNKQLDLQDLLRQAGRELALAQGWYAQRRIVQFGFVALLGVVVLAGAAVVAAKWRNRLPGDPLVWTGILLVGGYVVLRTLTFEHVTETAGLRLGDYAFARVAELAGAVCIGWAAFRAGKRIRPAA